MALLGLRKRSERSKTGKANRPKPDPKIEADKPDEPHSPDRNDSGVASPVGLEALPNDPGAQDSYQLTELRRRLTESVKSLRNETAPERPWSPPAPPPFPFLELPDDIRERVLTFALPIHGDEVHISSWKKDVTNLLRASPQLRSETTAILRSGKVFCFEIKDFDTSKLVKWFKRSPFRAFPVKVKVLKPERECWENLVKWLKCCYEWGCVGMSVSEAAFEGEEVKALRVARKMFRKVAELKKLDEDARPAWEEIVETLEGMREGVKLLGDSKVKMMLRECKSSSKRAKS